MKRFKNILFVVSDDSEDHAALAHAVRLAQNNQAKLTLVKAIEKLPETTLLEQQGIPKEMLRESVMKDHQQHLHALIAPFKDHLDISAKVLLGLPFLEIIREVLRNHHDLVIKTASGCRGAMARLFGSQEMHLLRKCPCPVWLIKAGHEQPFHKILAAVDIVDAGTAEQEQTENQLNHAILELASSLASVEQGELHVVHAWEAVGEEMLRVGRAAQPDKVVNTYVETIYRHHKTGVKALLNEVSQASMAHLHLRKGPAKSVIPELEADLKADLVVMGTLARTGVAGLFIGNTAETIIDQLDCSLLAIKPPGFVTPVKLDE